MLGGEGTLVAGKAALCEVPSGVQLSGLGNLFETFQVSIWGEAIKEFLHMTREKIHVKWIWTLFFVQIETDSSAMEVGAFGIFWNH